MSDTEWAIPVTTKTVHAIDYSDLERLVNSTYGFDKNPGEYGRNLWSFTANEECGNDSDHELSSEGKWIDEFHRENLEEFKAGDVFALQWDTNTIVWDLAERGLLPKGDILVNVSW